MGAIVVCDHQGVSRTWLSVRVELVSGHGEELWPRPGRVLAAARSHSFAKLATAIDDAFARWDRAHLHQFWTRDGHLIGEPDPDDEPRDDVLDERRTTLSRLEPGEQFLYEFDFGDAWLHLCTVGVHRIDPIETVGLLPGSPTPYWGWGASPTSTADAGTTTRETDPRRHAPRESTYRRWDPANTGATRVDIRPRRIGASARRCISAAFWLDPAAAGRISRRLRSSSRIRFEQASLTAQR